MVSKNNFVTCVQFKVRHIFFSSFSGPTCLCSICLIPSPRKPNFSCCQIILQLIVFRFDDFVLQTLNVQSLVEFSLLQIIFWIWKRNQNCDYCSSSFWCGSRAGMHNTRPAEMFILDRKDQRFSSIILFVW